MNNITHIVAKSNNKNAKKHKNVAKGIDKIKKLCYFLIAKRNKGGVIMRELIELKGKIRERKSNYRECAKIANISLNTFNSRINGRTAFDIIEASKLATHLGIPESEIKYFFA